MIDGIEYVYCIRRGGSFFHDVNAECYWCALWSGKVGPPCADCGERTYPGLSRCRMCGLMHMVEHLIICAKR